MTSCYWYYRNCLIIGTQNVSLCGDEQTLQQTYSPKEVQDAFKVLMTHWISQFAWRIAFRCVLHRCGSQDIRCWKCLDVTYIFPLRNNRSCAQKVMMSSQTECWYHTSVRKWMKIKTWVDTVSWLPSIFKDNQATTLPEFGKKFTGHTWPNTKIAPSEQQVLEVW